MAGHALPPAWLNEEAKVPLRRPSTASRRSGGKSVLGTHLGQAVSWVRCAPAQVPAFLVVRFNSEGLSGAKSLGLPSGRHSSRPPRGTRTDC